MPKKDTDALRHQICNRIAQGQSLKEICTESAMPSLTTVFNWLMPGHPQFNSDFLDRYRIARMWQSDSLIEKIIELSKDDSINPEAKKVQIDALKVAASKLEGRKYGDVKPRQITVKVVYVSQT